MVRLKKPLIPLLVFEMLNDGKKSGRYEGNLIEFRICLSFKLPLIKTERRRGRRNKIRRVEKS